MVGIMKVTPTKLIKPITPSAESTNKRKLKKVVEHERMADEIKNVETQITHIDERV